MENKTTDYAEIVAGFLKEFGVVGPLIQFATPDMKLSFLLRLRRPDKTIFIDAGVHPMKIEIDGPREDADIRLTCDADIFHHILWGNLMLSRALNERVALIEIKTGALPDMPAMKHAKHKRGKIPGKNKIYEAYLVNIGAAHLLDETEKPDLPLDPNRPIRTIELDPIPAGLFGRFSYSLMGAVGYLGGRFLKIYLDRWFKPPAAVVQNVEYLSYDDVFSPPLPPPPDMKGIKKAAFMFVFRRVDIFKVMGAVICGVEKSGALDKPLRLLNTFVTPAENT